MPEPANNPERYLLGVITDDELFYPEVRKNLGGEFRTVLASNEEQIKQILEQPELHAILFNLDCIGDGAMDGLEVLRKSGASATTW